MCFKQRYEEITFIVEKNSKHKLDLLKINNLVCVLFFFRQHYLHGSVFCHSYPLLLWTLASALCILNSITVPPILDSLDSGPKTQVERFRLATFPSAVFCKQTLPKWPTSDLPSERRLNHLIQNAISDRN